MDSKRKVIKDYLRCYLKEAYGENESAAYGCACEIADEIFAVLEISPQEQDRPVRTMRPFRLPVVTIGGISYFVDMGLKQLRNVQNPHDFFDFERAL
jgi:hypothetical protein